jgi:hypothetical protein
LVGVGQSLALRQQPVTAVPPWQVPFWQLPPAKQMSSFSHGVSFGAFRVSQIPVAGTHTLTLHGSVGVGHCTCWPVDEQTPFWHVSNVQRLLSLLHAVPLSLNWSCGH